MPGVGTLTAEYLVHMCAPACVCVDSKHSLSILTHAPRVCVCVRVEATRVFVWRAHEEKKNVICEMHARRNAAQREVLSPAPEKWGVNNECYRLKCEENDARFRVAVGNFWVNQNMNNLTIEERSIYWKFCTRNNNGRFTQKAATSIGTNIPVPEFFITPIWIF